MTEHPTHDTPAQPARAATLPTPDGALGLLDAGEGPLVLTSPGMGDLKEGFAAIASGLVAAGRRVASLDLRGHGDSDADFPAYGSTQTAADLGHALDHLDAGPAVLVGNSMSAGSAVLLAAARPEAVAGLVLTGPFVRDPGGSAFARVAQRALFRVLTMRPWGTRVWDAYLPRLYAGRRPDDFTEHRARIAAALRRPGHARAFALTTRTSHAAAEAALPRAGCPVLVVMGEQDPDFPDPAAEARWIADQVGGEVLMVPDAGHYPHAQRPDLVVPAVAAFLDRIGHG